MVNGEKIVRAVSSDLELKFQDFLRIHKGFRGSQREMNQIQAKVFFYSPRYLNGENTSEWIISKKIFL